MFDDSIAEQDILDALDSDEGMVEGLESLMQDMSIEESIESDWLI